MGATDNSASSAIRKLLSACSGGTCRSSPQKKCMRAQGNWSRRAGSVASSWYRPRGVEPPDSATVNRPLAATESTARKTNSDAAAWNSASLLSTTRRSPATRTRAEANGAPAAADHDVVGQKRATQLLNHRVHLAAPLLLAQALQAAQARDILVGLLVLVR